MRNLRRTILKFLIIFLGTVSIFAQPASERTSPENAIFQGFWEGEIVRGGKIWGINFDIGKDGETYQALAHFIDLDVMDIPY